MIQGDAINANGNSTVTQFSTIVDTGTTLILGDQTMVGQFYSGLNATNLGNGFYTREF
jgi:cathepsin D